MTNVAIRKTYNIQELEDLQDLVAKIIEDYVLNLYSIDTISIQYKIPKETIRKILIENQIVLRVKGNRA